MSRSRRGNIMHKTTLKDIPSGVSAAMDKVRELNEGELEEQDAKPVPSELRDLVLFGLVIEDVVFGGYTFNISTLSNRQQKRLVRRLMTLDSEDRVMNVKPLTLSQAIRSVNGVPLEDLYDGEEGLSVDDQKVEVISDFQSNLVDKLFDSYEELMKKSNTFFESGELSEQVKN